MECGSQNLQCHDDSHSLLHLLCHDDDDSLQNLWHCGDDGHLQKLWFNSNEAKLGSPQHHDCDVNFAKLVKEQSQNEISKISNAMSLKLITKDMWHCVYHSWP